MPLPDDDHRALVDLLSDQRIEVEEAGSTLNLTHGSGAGEIQRNIDPVPFLESLSGAEGRERRRRLAGYVSGVKHALLEPPSSDGDAMEFSEAAGRTAQRLEVETFVQGAGAVGDEPYTLEFADDIVTAFLIELDQGIRVVTRQQFDEWSATEDRIVEAGRSILYHKAQTTDPTPLEDHPAIERLHVGDGYDAARSIVLDDLFFGEFDDASRISMPTPEHLLFSRAGDEAGVTALREATDAVWEEAAYPLSRQLYRFERSRPTPVED